jgi:hypothetical protein
MKHKITNQRNRSHRRGLFMTELIVAAILLITSLSLLVTLSFRTGKLWQDSRHYTLAVNELTNQLERLTALDAAEIDEQLAELAPSAAIQAALPNPKIAGEKLTDEYGVRVRLEIEWDRPGNAKPVTLTAWVTPSTEEDEP